MKKIYLVGLLSSTLFCANAQVQNICEEAVEATSETVLFPLDSIVFDVDPSRYWPVATRTGGRTSTAAPHPVFFKLFTQGTLYGDAVHQAVTFDEQDATGDAVLVANNAINDALIKSFVAQPWLFTTTQTSISDQTTVADIAATVPAAVQPTTITQAPAETEIVWDDDVDVDIRPEKPNFWKFDGTGSMQFTQNHFSDNWYQGGESNYAMLAHLKLHFLYDNKQKLQWETTLSGQLGFQTVENDEYRKFRANSDQLRLDTKLGYKAAKHWFYTVQAEATTQFTRSYTANSPDIVGDFMSPLKTVVSIGMDYKHNRSKLTGSVYMSPLAMTWMYVDRLDLATRYGNDEEKHSKITWGPYVKVEYTWKPWENFSWTGRMYYFSNFEFVNLEWENTFSFSFNKYVTAKLYMYPRFDDSSEKYATEHGSYFMFKEWMSLGLEYSF